MYLEMREINKDLKKHFKDLEEKVEMASSLEDKENSSGQHSELLMMMQEMVKEWKLKMNWDSMVSKPTARREDRKTVIFDTHKNMVIS